MLANDAKGQGMINGRLAMLGGLMLLVGLGVYVFGRHVVPILAIPVTYGLPRDPGMLTWLLGFVPSFIHALAFCLLTACLFHGTVRTNLIICISWAGLHVLLEIGQIPSVSSMLTPLFSQGAAYSFVTLRVAAYFSRGVFDIMDVIAALLGSLAGYFIMDHDMTTNSAQNQGGS